MIVVHEYVVTKDADGGYIVRVPQIEKLLDEHGGDTHWIRVPYRLPCFLREEFDPAEAGYVLRPVAERSTKEPSPICFKWIDALTEST